MATESIYQQFIQQLRTTLRAIDPVADSEYWYAPQHVVLADVLDSVFLESAPKKYVIMIGPGDEYEEERTSGTVGCIAQIFVLCAQPWKPSTVDPFRQADDAVTRWRLQNRMVRDVLRAILADVTLNSLVSNCAIKEIDRNFEVPERWAVVLIMFGVEYDYMKDAP